MAPIEVINASLGRTGTDSFCEAIDILGYNCHHMYKLLEDVTYNTTKPFYDAAFNREEANMDELYAGYNACADWTGAYFYRQLFARYPKAKVIISERPFDDWFKSMKNTLYQTIRGGVELGQDHPRYYFRLLLRKITLDGYILDNDKYLDEEFMRNYYNSHIQEIKELVPADQLYCYKLGESWEGLCAFLGKDVPKVPYPNKNSTAQYQAKVKAKLARDDANVTAAAGTSDQNGVVPINNLAIRVTQN